MRNKIENWDKRRNDGLIESRQFGQLAASIEEVSFSTYDRILFNQASFQIHKNERVAITGKSGCGKTVMLKLLTGDEIPETGEVMISKNNRISYVPQDIEDMNISPYFTVKEVFWKARGLDKIENEMRNLESKMKSIDCSENILNRFGEVQENYSQLGGWSAESEMETILFGLGLDESTSGHIKPDTKIGEVSSGQKTKILLGQALFSNADLLILDDPTSHLDVETVNWLGDYIKSSKQAIVYSTQNYDFINRTSDRIVEITDSGRVLSFTGSWKDYTVKRDAILVAEEARAKSLQQEYDLLYSTWQKFRNEGVFRRSDKMASRGRAIESRLKRMKDQIQGIPQGGIPIQKSREKYFETKGRESTEAIVSIDDTVLKYGDYEAVSFSGINIQVKRGDRLLIEGNNGSGKSTLLRALSRSHDKTFLPDSGKASVGHNLVIGYYAPDNMGIPRKGNVFEYLLSVMDFRDEPEAVSILTYFGFPYQGIRERSIETLSSGEKIQLSLSSLMAKKPDILLLDEPTDNLNNLIIERLTNSLNNYTGSLLLISHNPEFKDSLKMTHSIEISEGKLVNYSKK